MVPRRINGKGVLRLLERFIGVNPGIDLRVEISTEPVDFKRSEVHAAIRLGAGARPAARRAPR
jgi:hypothetical protein